MEHRSRSFLLLSLLCATIALAVLIPGLGGGFILDDESSILTNARVHLTTLDAPSLLDAANSFPHGNGNRPLSMASFGLDHWWGGLNPQAFKTTNLLIHALTTVAMAYFLRILLLSAAWPRERAARVALSLALLWAVHPLQVSSVLYVVQRMQTLVTLFLILGMLAYLKARMAQIEGTRSGIYWGIVLLCWGLASISKEDGALLPIYLLLIEFVILRFRAPDPAMEKWLRRICLLLVSAGIMFYFLVIVPRYWSWDNYPSRDFSSYERLLTQGRVLVMYLGQILFPLPSQMPFYYDDLVVSRGLFQPRTTLPALLLLSCLLIWAWRWRQLRPVFTFGVLLFFAGHFITSNVIGLELAFEHRNHLPMIGAMLAVADLLMAAIDRRYLHPRGVVLLIITLGITMCSLGALRAHAWGDSVRLARHLTEIAPNSSRAWNALCGTLYKSSGNTPSHLELAIASCERANEIPGSAIPLFNIVTFKSLNGTITDTDWERFFARLRTAPINIEIEHIMWRMMQHVTQKLPVDEQRAVETIQIIADRANFPTQANIAVANFIMDHTTQPESAYPYLVRAIETVPVNESLVSKMLSDLVDRGRSDWAGKLQKIKEKSDPKAE